MIEQNNHRQALEAVARLRHELLLTSAPDCPLARDILAVCDAFESSSAKLNAPELHDFAKGAVLEAAHQRHRWGAEQDAGKGPADWFWLIGYLAGKALRAHIDGDVTKALHHTISTAAALNNWHAQILDASKEMRPGIAEEKRPA